MIAVSFLAAGIGYVVSLYARLALAIILAVGPIFVALALFQSTRRFTEARIGQLVNFVILQVLVVAVGSLLISCIDSTFTAIDAYSDVLMRPIALCAIGIAALYVFINSHILLRRWPPEAHRLPMGTARRVMLMRVCLREAPEAPGAPLNALFVSWGERLAPEARTHDVIEKKRSFPMNRFFWSIALATLLGSCASLNNPLPKCDGRPVVRSIARCGNGTRTEI